MSEEPLLIDRMRQGDKQALAEFIVLREAQLLAYIQRQMSDALQRKIEPRDLLQEVAAEAVRSLDDAVWTDREPFGWLCQVAQHRIVDAHRRYFGAQKRNARREVSLDAPAGRADSSRKAVIDLVVVSMTTASEAFSRGEKEVQLLEAMKGLGEEQREALRLRYVENLPSKEIAARLGKSDGAVRVMLTRALDKLQKIMELET